LVCRKKLRKRPTNLLGAGEFGRRNLDEHFKSYDPVIYSYQFLQQAAKHMTGFLEKCKTCFFKEFYLDMVNKTNSINSAYHE
jgi:hypothetical protein